MHEQPQRQAAPPDGPRPPKTDKPRPRSAGPAWTRKPPWTPHPDARNGNHQERPAGRPAAVTLHRRTPRRSQNTTEGPTALQEGPTARRRNPPPTGPPRTVRPLRPAPSAGPPTWAAPTVTTGPAAPRTTTIATQAPTVTSRISDSPTDPARQTRAWRTCCPPDQRPQRQPIRSAGAPATRRTTRNGSSPANTQRIRRSASDAAHQTQRIRRSALHHTTGTGGNIPWSAKPREKPA